MPALLTIIAPAAQYIYLRSNRHVLQACIDALQLQKDQFESEIEGLDTKKKGNKEVSTVVCCFSVA